MRLLRRCASRNDNRTALAVAVAWAAYALFYLVVFVLVVGIPIGLLILVARVLLS
jgi:hypothetical protein